MRQAIIVMGGLALAIFGCGEDGASSGLSGAGGTGGAIATTSVASSATSGSGASTGAGGSGGAEVPPIAIPGAEEFTDHGLIFSEGVAGDWDRYLWGGFAGVAVKHQGSYFLYYQGSDDYIDAPLYTVSHRAIGVATSSDGVAFTKHPANPLITWLPNDGIEEGAVSSGAFVAPDGSVAMYYGANTEISADQVNADARLAMAPDGIAFRDHGVVLDHADATVWGSGDELFPVIGFAHGGSWFTYYIPNGTPQKGLLGVAWGTGATSLAHSAGTTAGGPVEVWGMAGHAEVDDGVFALFLSTNAGTVDVYLVTNLEAPQELTGPVASYAFSNMQRGTVLLDRDTDRWLLYYRNEDHSAYGVRTAPVSYR